MPAQRKKDVFRPRYTRFTSCRLLRGQWGEWSQSRLTSPKSFHVWTNDELRGGKQGTVISVILLIPINYTRVYEKEMGVVGKLKLVQMRKIVGGTKAQSCSLAKKKKKGCGNQKLEHNLYIAFQSKMVTEIMKVYVSLPPSLLFLASWEKGSFGQSRCLGNSPVEGLLCHGDFCLY